MESSVQDIAIATPGAKNAKCTMDINGFKYTVSPPQIVNVTKTKEKMVLTCSAPGNRQRVVFVEPIFSKFFVPGAIATVGAGGLWDYASGAAFRYPDIVEVDFSKTPVKPEALPDHNADDIRAPESYLLEEYLSKEPRLNSDRFEPQVEIRLRQKSTQRSVLTSGYGESYSDEESVIDGELQDMGFDLDNESGLVEALDPSGTLIEESEPGEIIDIGPPPDVNTEDVQDVTP